MWCQRMVDEAEKGVRSKITPVSKSLLIKTANNLVEKQPDTVKKSFEAAGSIESNDHRKDSTYTEIKKVIEDVFGKLHMGHVQPSDNPFANYSDDSDTEEDPFANCSDDSDAEEDPFANCSDDSDAEEDPCSDDSDTDFSDLSSTAHSDVEDLDLVHA